MKRNYTAESELYYPEWVITIKSLITLFHTIIELRSPVRDRAQALIAIDHDSTIAIKGSNSLSQDE